MYATLTATQPKLEAAHVQVGSNTIRGSRWYWTIETDSSSLSPNGNDRYFGSAKLRIKSPPLRPLSPPPDATATNSSPLII